MKLPNEKKALLLTSATLLSPAPVSAALADMHTSISAQKIDEIRERLNKIETNTKSPVFNVKYVSDDGQHWLAWGNWGNWNDWPNWSNWGNWPNWGNY